MRLFVERSVRRCVGLAILLFFTVPFGLSVIGCGHHSAPPVYCSVNVNSGPVVGQAFTITLAPTLAVIGESLNYGQIGQGLSATTTDCKGNSVSVSKYTYSTTNLNFADINPSTGAVCGGTWNRNTGSGIPDFTICSAPVNPPANAMAFITANADGVTSNAIAVYVHPTVTAVQLATPLSASNSCPANPTNPGTDPTSDCCPNATTTPEPPAPGYDGTSCVSQNNRVQLAGKVYYGGFTDAAHNITCQVGHLTFTAQGSANVVTIDSEGFATANQPGSSTVTATISNSNTASNAGFFSTCPPASIVLTAVGQTGNPINVGLNNPQPLRSYRSRHQRQADHRHQSRVQLHHSADNLCLVRLRPSQLPRLGQHHRRLPARHLQSVAAQPGRLSRQRHPAHLQQHHGQHRGQQRRGHLHGQHRLAIRRAL